MGLFDQLKSSLEGALGELPGELASQLEADAPGFLNQALSNTPFGSVSGLVAKLEEGGLGTQVSSWLDSGSNLPVSAEQIHAALGNAQVQEIAEKLGLPADKLSEMLAHVLPNTVDKMSPNGSIVDPAQ